MSSYTARRDRKRLRKEARQHRAELHRVEDQAAYDVDAALSALGRARYSRPVRFSEPSAVLEYRPPKVPYIDMKLFAKRMVLDHGLIKAFGNPLTLVKLMERQTADELARYMIDQGLVCIDRAKVHMFHPSDHVEYDFAVYVGRPVEVGET